MPNKNALVLEKVRKVFGKDSSQVVALNSTDLEIKDNEFFTLLGPSGCGKTTLLRIIAGLENTTSGIVYLHGKDVTEVPSYKRPVNTVFQSYALFPHMTLRENIAFPLKMLKWQDHNIQARVAEMLKMVDMESFANRYPNQLSGGQKQRIALVRALAPKPQVLLLDEPLSALDLKLRQKMREELRQIQRKSNVTFVFVTHDQEEALDMSDRVCVLANGDIQQIGTPIDIFENPINKFVADFIGETNFLPVKIEDIMDKKVKVCCELGKFEFPASNLKKGQKDVVISIRPEKISVNEKSDEYSFDAKVIHSSYMGGYSHYRVRLKDGLELKISQRNRISNQEMHKVGNHVNIGFKLSSMRLLGQ